jgi:DNA-binding response OmpR family regulator
MRFTFVLLVRTGVNGIDRTEVAVWSPSPIGQRDSPPGQRSAKPLRAVDAYSAGVDERRILVVEDDEAIGRGLSLALAGQGYTVGWAPTASDALRDATEAAPDLVLLDLGLPDLDGVELCRRLRAVSPGTTIVMLTARADEIDVVVGLDAGADDYITKPFRLAELLARVRAHLRRAEPVGATGRLVVGRLELDAASHRMWVSGREVDLRPKEFDLLALLMAEAGRVVGRERIMAEVWDEHWFGSTKTLDMHVSALRKKLIDAGDVPNRLSTVRGVGYRLEPL